MWLGRYTLNNSIGLGAYHSLTKRNADFRQCVSLDLARVEASMQFAHFVRRLVLDARLIYGTVRHMRDLPGINTIVNEIEHNGAPNCCWWGLI